MQCEGGVSPPTLQVQSSPNLCSHGITLEREGRERLKTLGLYTAQPVTPSLLPAGVTHVLGWPVEGWDWSSPGSQIPQAGSALSMWLVLAEASLLCCSFFLVVPAVFPVSGSHPLAFKSQPERPFRMVSFCLSVVRGKGQWLSLCWE